MLFAYLTIIPTTNPTANPLVVTTLLIAAYPPVAKTAYLVLPSTATISEILMNKDGAKNSIKSPNITKVGLRGPTVTVLVAVPAAVAGIKSLAICLMTAVLVAVLAVAVEIRSPVIGLASPHTPPTITTTPTTTPTINIPMIDTLLINTPNRHLLITQKVTTL